MARINPRQVEAFRAVMLTGSVTAAANLMAVTQPAVSRLLRDLQELLRLQLFEKRGTGLVPTAAAMALFTEVERNRSERKPDAASSYAKRFAAKEACAKALGTGIRQGVWWRDMGVVNLPGGRPTMQLTGGALKRLHALVGGSGAALERRKAPQTPGQREEKSRRREA